jgi:hypothetical protein
VSERERGGNPFSHSLTDLMAGVAAIFLLIAVVFILIAAKRGERAVSQVAEFERTGPFVVKSQDNSHPFYVGQYMSGCKVLSGSRPSRIRPVYACQASECCWSDLPETEYPAQRRSNPY